MYIKKEVIDSFYLVQFLCPLQKIICIFVLKIRILWLTLLLLTTVANKH